MNKSGQLSPIELEKVTSRKRISAQRRVLDFMGIKYKPRPDGSIFVMWEWIHEMPQPHNPEQSEPDWDRVPKAS